MQLDKGQLASQAQFQRQSARYGKNHILADISDIAKAAEHLDLPEVAQVLDVATGGGHTALFFAKQGHKVTAADIASAMLVNAAALCAEQGLTIETRQHIAETLPYPDRSFDLVTCRVAPHHFSNVAVFVAESARVLKPGGWFLVIDGSVPDNQTVAEEWMHRIEKARDPSHGRFIPPTQWRSFCEKSNLEVTTCELAPMKMPDLDWYFDTASTPSQNRREVLDLIENAPAEARESFQLTREDGKPVWYWTRLTLIARKN